MFENTSVDYNTGKTDKFSTSLCIRGYYHGWLLTVSHHIVQVVMVAQHCFCCWVTGIHVLNVTTTIMMASNVNKHSSKELHRSGLKNQHLFLRCRLQVMSPYMTNPATLWKGKQQIFVSSMLIKVKNPVCNQSTHLSNKPLEAQESHENSPKPHVESNFRSLHSYLDQNNETFKKQINIAHFLFCHYMYH